MHVVLLIQGYPGVPSWTAPRTGCRFARFQGTIDSYCNGFHKHLGVFYTWIEQVGSEKRF